MRKQSDSILAVVATVLSAFLAFGVMALFHACGPKEDGTWMSCHHAQLAVFVLALVMTLLSAVSISGGRKLAVVMRILTMVCALAAAVIPGNVIRLCMMNEMRCRAVMRPSVILLSVLIIVFSLIGLISGNSRGRRRTGERKEHI